MRKKIHTARRARPRMLLPAALLLGGALTACDSLLEVELPGQVTEEGTLQPELAATLVTSAIADFECSYSMAASLTAAMEDTWWRGTGYWQNWAEYRLTRPSAARCAESDQSTGWYQGMQTSRFMAEQAYEHISEWTDEQVENREQLLAAAATYAGLSYQFFGEIYCELAVDVGPAMTPTEVLQQGENWFDTALGHIQNTGDFSIATTSSIEQLALLGRARTRFAMGDLPGAAEDASRIQPGFVAYITRDGTVRPRWNHTYRQLNVNLYSSIAGPVVHLGETQPFTNYRFLTFDDQGRAVVNGMPVSEFDPTVEANPNYLNFQPETPDPRVPVVFTGEFLQDGVTDNWQQLKFTGYGDPIPLARWAEAQLILAEIEARNGNGASAVARINALRDVHDLPHLTATEAAGGWTTLRDDIIEERRREFFFEGRFLGTKLRKDLWFPDGIGANHKGFSYGDVRCFLMPESEYNTNPNLPDV